MERIRWSHFDESADAPDHLEAELSTYVTVGMRMQPDGNYAISWVMQIDGTRRSLPEVEDFIARVAAFMDREPVVPPPWVDE